MSANTALSVIIAYVVLLLTTIVGWFGNLFWTFQQTDVKGLIIGGIGAIVPPFGAIHYFFFS